MAARIGDADEADAISDINVTPLVDVVLVLLIVFMITMPALVGSAPVEVDVPTTTEIATQLTERDVLPLKVFVRQEPSGESRVYLGEHVIAINNFKNFLGTLGDIDKESPVQIAADQGLPYRDVVSVMDSLSSVGIHKISLETKHVEATP